MTFRDRAFCSASKLCATTDCPRHFGDTARAEARKWWGDDDPPVQFNDFRETCGKFQPVTEDTHATRET